MLSFGDSFFGLFLFLEWFGFGSVFLVMVLQGVDGGKPFQELVENRMASQYGHITFGHNTQNRCPVLM